MSRSRIRSIGGKVPWEHEKTIWFDEMGYDCIASGVMVLRTWYQLCGLEQRRVIVLLLTSKTRIYHGIRKSD